MPVFKPSTKQELVDWIVSEIERQGPSADLNNVDLSKLKDLIGLFSTNKTIRFNGDISQWDVSKVEDMTGMFSESHFNGDISKWNVSKVQ